jgi:hypothetical protein
VNARREELLFALAQAASACYWILRSGLACLWTRAFNFQFRGFPARINRRRIANLFSAFLIVLVARISLVAKLFDSCS